MSDEIANQRQKERNLKRKMEDLHFANMVQYEASMKAATLNRQGTDSGSFNARK